MLWAAEGVLELPARTMDGGCGGAAKCGMTKIQLMSANVL